MPDLFWQETENAQPVGGLAPLWWSKEVSIWFMDDAGTDATNSRPNWFIHPPWLVIHPLSQEDSVAVAALRSAVAPMKGKLEGTGGRGPFNYIMERIAVPEGVTFEAAMVGGISGWWAKPARTQEWVAIIHVHGGWFNWGTAKAYRNLAGHIALSGGTDAFIPGYRLAAEHG